MKSVEVFFCIHRSDFTRLSNRRGWVGRESWVVGRESWVVGGGSWVLGLGSEIPMYTCHINILLCCFKCPLVRDLFLAYTLSDS